MVGVEIVRADPMVLPFVVDRDSIRVSPGVAAVVSESKQAIKPIVTAFNRMFSRLGRAPTGIVSVRIYHDL